MTLESDDIDRLGDFRDRFIRYKGGLPPSSHLTDFLYHVTDDVEWLLEMVSRLSDESVVSLEDLDTHLSDATKKVNELKATFEAAQHLLEENRVELERLRSSPEGRLATTEKELHNVKDQLRVTNNELSRMKAERDKLKAIVDNLPPTRHQRLMDRADR